MCAMLRVLFNLIAKTIDCMAITLTIQQLYLSLFTTLMVFTALHMEIFMICSVRFKATDRLLFCHGLSVPWFHSLKYPSNMIIYWHNYSILPLSLHFQED